MKRRGQSLLEGLIASVVLVIGITGVLQAVLVSSQQNAGAGRITEASTIAQQVVNGIMRHDIRELKSSGFLSTGSCVSGADLAYVGALNSVTTITGGSTRCSKGACVSSDVTLSGCVKDIDAYDASAPINRKLVPGYPSALRYVSGSPQGYKRMAIIYDNTTTSRTIDVVVVVSFLEGGIRRFQQRTVTMFTPIGFAGL